MLVVNMFAGPGAGKSTLAAGVFARLKNIGIKAELVTEYAKDVTWEEAAKKLACQPYLFGKQYWRLKRLEGHGVKVAVTDSPILLGYVYSTAEPMSFTQCIRDYFDMFDNLNVFVERVKPYAEYGRSQTEIEAIDLDGHIEHLLTFAGLHLRVTGDETGVPAVVAAVTDRLAGRA